MRWIVFVMALIVSPVAAESVEDSIVTESCREPCYVLPYTGQEGGFVVRPAYGILEVPFMFRCGGGHYITGTIPVSGRPAVQEIGPGTGFYCPDGRGDVWVSGILDGSWYWTVDDEGYAAASLLLRRDLVESYRAVRPVDPRSAGFTLTTRRYTTKILIRGRGRGGTMLVPNFFPSVGDDPTLLCGWDGIPDGPIPPRLIKRDCLVTGEYEIHVDGPGGERSLARVTRPASGSIELVLAVYGKGVVELRDPPTGLGARALNSPVVASFEIGAETGVHLSGFRNNTMTVESAPHCTTVRVRIAASVDQSSQLYPPPPPKVNDSITIFCPDGEGS